MKQVFNAGSEFDGWWGRCASVYIIKGTDTDTGLPLPHLKICMNEVKSLKMLLHLPMNY